MRQAGNPFGQGRTAVDYVQNVDYVYIINSQLARISKARSKFEGPPLHPGDPPPIVALEEYLAAVEALYALLLPHLRMGSEEYLSKARKLYKLTKKYMALKDEYDKCEYKRSAYSIMARRLKSKIGIEPRATPGKEQEEKDGCENRFGGMLKEVDDKIQAIIEEMPEDVKSAVGEALTVFHAIYFIIDKAVEKMLTNLDKAGLLIKSRRIMVGAANDPGRSH
ncbi:MAG: hypothetical protein F7B19_06675 [Desulfurococcales archaeon]|nr:hypothetical protein [Desulfurococcales archaeon]